MAELAILDVGHGNCAVLYDKDEAILIDTGGECGDILIDFLHAKHIEHIKAVIISHAHEDHLHGLATLLADTSPFRVVSILMNPDPACDTRLLKMIRQAIAKKRNEARAKRSDDYPRGDKNLNADAEPVRLGNAVAEILAPEHENAIAGVGGRTLENKKITQHSHNAVIRVLIDGIPVALLPGDLNKEGLNNLETQSRPAHANALIFPHHGGHSGSDDAQFAEKLRELVNPAVVVFSLGRFTEKNPQPAIVQALRKGNGSLRLACTQLSQHCATQIPKNTDHLNDAPASGKRKHWCCAGTIILTVEDKQVVTSPRVDDHRKFIASNTDKALCAHNSF